MWRNIGWPIALIAIAGTASAQPASSGCKVPPTIEAARFPDDFPKTLVVDFGVHYSPYAAIGERFDIEQKDPSLPPRGVVASAHSGKRWMIAYVEQKRSYFPAYGHALFYDVEADGSVKLVDHEGFISLETLCYKTNDGFSSQPDK